MTSALTQNKTLWWLFTLTLVLTIAFGVVMQIWDFVLIDEMFNAEQISNHIDALSATQKQVHIWTTVTLDVVYPFAYAGLFAGLTLKAFGKTGTWLALPIILCVPVDLTEGFAQVMLLSDNARYMNLKTAMTPVKLGLFVFGLIVALVSLGKLYRARKLV